MRRLAVRAALLAAAPIVASVATAYAAGPVRYPDLKTLPPDNLHFATQTIAGRSHVVLRFGNTAWNAGPGVLELQATPIDAHSATAYQRLLDADGRLVVRRKVGRFVFHPSHDHFHLENFARYQLWTRAGYDAWIASGRTSGSPIHVSQKVSFCLLDTFRIASGGPASRVYANCTRSGLSGISVGWGDWYSARLPGQLIDVGRSRLANGEYVLRSVADPGNILWESPGKATESRESQSGNAAITPFRVAAGVAYEHLVADDFESGTLGRWTARRGAALQTGTAFSGTRSARLTAGGGPAFLRRSIRLGRDGVRLDMRFAVQSQQTRMGLAAILDDHGRTIAEVYAGAEGKLWFRNGVTGWTRATGGIVRPGAWHRLQLRLALLPGLDRSSVVVDAGKAFVVSGRFGVPAGRYAFGDPHRGHRFTLAVDDAVAEAFKPRG